MVNFELCKEIKKDFFVLLRAWDKEIILSPHEESIPRGDSECYRCSTLVTRRRTYFFNLIEVWILSSQKAVTVIFMLEI